MKLAHSNFWKMSFLNHSVDFGVGFTFYKSPRPAFSQGQCPGPGLGSGSLYKV